MGAAAGDRRIDPDAVQLRIMTFTGYEVLLILIGQVMAIGVTIFAVRITIEELAASIADDLDQKVKEFRNQSHVILGQWRNLRG